MSEQSEELRMATAYGRVMLATDKATKNGQECEKLIQYLVGDAADMEFLADELEKFNKAGEHLIESIRNRAKEQINGGKH